LGTSAQQPTTNRNLQSTLLIDRDETIMIDCGEGTQRQMRIIKIPPTKITRLLLTHLHADHIIGIAGLMRSLGANQYTKTLEIYGPRGTKQIYKSLVEDIPGNPRIKVNIHEIKEGEVFTTKHLEVHAKKLNHSITCYGYSIKEKDKLKINTSYLKKYGLTQHPILGTLQKGRDITWEGKKIKVKDATIPVLGKKVTIILDTIYCENAIKLAEDSTTLICESTYSIKDKVIAKEHNHMTAQDAANIAKKSGSKKLILTHFSQRYKSTIELKKEAKKIFTNVTCAEDFMKIKI